MIRSSSASRATGPLRFLTSLITWLGFVHRLPVHHNDRKITIRILQDDSTPIICGPRRLDYSHLGNRLLNPFINNDVPAVAGVGGLIDARSVCVICKNRDSAVHHLSRPDVYFDRKTWQATVQHPSRGPARRKRDDFVLL